MPYSGADDSNLPDNVKKMPMNKRKQWIHVFNGAMADGKSESDAFAMANGVAKKEKGYIWDWSDVDNRQLDWGSAGYEAMGGGEGKGCGNCNWYVPGEDACVLVQGDIVPTGLCKMHMMTPEETVKPIPVTIVKETSLIDRLKSLLGLRVDDSTDAAPTTNQPAPPQGPVLSGKELAVETAKQGKEAFWCEKGTDGLRFFAVYSNVFKDKQGEILEEAAHKEFIEWVTTTKSYPELWLWHAGPASKWGKTDWLEYADGFAIASGLVDAEKEYIAEALTKEEIGVSHGFYAMVDKATNVIKMYRTFEISPLPIKAAANEFTDFATAAKEASMAFTKEKRAWLKDKAGVSDETITNWEASLSGMSEKLKALGIEFKEANEEQNLVADLLVLTKAVGDLVGAVTALKEGQTALAKSIDERVAEIFASKMKAPDVVPPSQQENNVVDQLKEKDTGNLDWFSTTVMKGF